MKKQIALIIPAAMYFVLADKTLSSGPPAPGGTNDPCTNCTSNQFSLPTMVERYGYYVHMQWTNDTQSTIALITWDPSNYLNECSLVPTSHVCIVSNGVPLQQDNTNDFAHEPTIYSDGKKVAAIFWAPNAFSFKRGFRFGQLNGTWLEIPGNAATNFSKDPNNPDPWWPVTFSGPVATAGGYFRLRRMDSGLGWTNVCE